MSDLKQLLESIYGELEHGATTSAMAKLKSYIDEQNASICAENAALKEALGEIATTAHCIALAGPLNTPTLQDAWSKFMKIDSMASNALAKNQN